MATGKTILIVDDDLELSDGLRVVLERLGYRIIQARDGQQGKQMVYNHRPDLMNLDMMMPRMGGYPVLEHFRGKPDAPPVIMITANEGSRHKAYAEYLGVVDYIRKPFAMERLLEADQVDRLMVEIDPGLRGQRDAGGVGDRGERIGIGIARLPDQPRKGGGEMDDMLARSARNLEHRARVGQPVRQHGRDRIAVAQGRRGVTLVGRRAVAGHPGLRRHAFACARATICSRCSSRAKAIAIPGSRSASRSPSCVTVRNPESRPTP